MVDIDSALDILDLHKRHFDEMVEYARRTAQPLPLDTRGWSQILVSALTGIDGPGRQKGADLIDGSDVKGASTWEAIDTPRFNGCIKAGTKAKHSDSVASLDRQPFLFFVLWDHTTQNVPRCRCWVVRTDRDKVFRSMARLWYDKRAKGEIVSSNFQLHPPRGLDTNVFRNTCGNLIYPLIFEAQYRNARYECTELNEDAIQNGRCQTISA